MCTIANYQSRLENLRPHNVYAGQNCFERAALTWRPRLTNSPACKMRRGACLGIAGTIKVDRRFISFLILYGQANMAYDASACNHLHKSQSMFSLDFSEHEVNT